MKILFISNLYPPNVVGGYERLCFEMAEALAKRGHEVTVLTSDYGGRTEDYPAQTIHRTLRLFADSNNIYQAFSCGEEERHTRSAGNIQELERVVAACQPERIFVWNLFFLDAPFLSALQEQKAPKVFLLTDNWLIAFLNPGFIGDYFAQRVHGQARPSRLQRWLNRLPRQAPAQWQLAGRAIFASRFMRDLYREAGFAFSRDTIVYHGVHLDPAGGKARDRDKLRRKGKLSLLFAGRIVDLKGVHTAVEALPKIQAALPDIQVSLTIVGDSQDGPYLERVKQMAEKQGDSIHFQPPVKPEELSALFDQHDIYLFPSLYEPFSLTLILALWAGIPTVASDAGGNVEIVRHRHSGMLFAKGDAGDLARQAITLARQPHLRERIANQGALRAGGHTFSNMVAAVERELAS